MKKTFKLYTINISIIILVVTMYTLSGLGVFNLFEKESIKYQLIHIIELIIIALCISSILLKIINKEINEKCSDINSKINKVDKDRITLYEETKKILIRINEYNQNLHNKLDEYEKLINTKIIKNIIKSDEDKLSIQRDLYSINRECNKLLSDRRRNRNIADFFNDNR